jgi:hypothetical protein
MSTDTQISNIIIEGNTFDYGNFPINTGLATVPTNYGYDNCIVISGDAQINNNYFSGALSGSTQVAVAFEYANYGASCNINNNTFVRGATVITAYIDVSTVTYDQVIVDNIFDSPTVDGFNQTLVLLPPVASATGPFVLYERNKNQTAIKQIQKSPYIISNAATPTINPAERSVYTDNTSFTYSPALGYYTSNLIPSLFKHEGMAMNYITPFGHSSAVKLGGPFTLTNGSTLVSTTNGPGVMTNGGFSVPSYIVFGDDNKYYQIASVVTGVGSPTNVIYTITLTSAYIGPTSIASNAIFFPGVVLAQTLPGTFNVTNLSAAVVASVSQITNLIVGSKMIFGTSSNTIYTVVTIDTTGINITISPVYQVTSNPTITATAGIASASFNFSINLSEVLPENVQVLSTIFGVYGGGSAVANLILGEYNASITTDSGGIYAKNLPGTFTVTNGSPTVTATSSQTGLITTGSSIVFSSLSYIVYSVLSVTGGGLTITLNNNYSNPNASGVSAENFDNTLADAVNYSITGGTTVGFGNNITLYVNNGVGGTLVSLFDTTTQYLKIDPGSFGFSAYTGSGRLLRYNLNITLIAATPTALFFPDSPLIVRYRW